MPARLLEALARDQHPVEELRHGVEDDQRCGARERIADVGVREHVLWPEVPDLLELGTNEERRGDRQPAPERLPGQDHVGQDIGAPDHARPAESAVDRVADEQRARLVAALPQRLEEPVGAAPARPRAPAPARRSRSRRPPGAAPDRRRGETVHRPWQPRGKRLAKGVERGRRERQQPGAVIGAVEGEDPRLAGREQRRPQPDLDRVLARDAELRGPGRARAAPRSPPPRRDRRARGRRAAPPRPRR